MRFGQAAENASFPMPFVRCRAAARLGVDDWRDALRPDIPRRLHDVGPVKSAAFFTRQHRKFFRPLRKKPEPPFYQCVSMWPCMSACSPNRLKAWRVIAAVQCGRNRTAINALPEAHRPISRLDTHILAACGIDAELPQSKANKFRQIVTG